MKSFILSCILVLILIVAVEKNLLSNGMIVFLGVILASVCTHAFFKRLELKEENNLK